MKPGVRPLRVVHSSGVSMVRESKLMEKPLVLIVILWFMIVMLVLVNLLRDW